MPPKKTSSTPITSIHHQDTRANIPTNELRDFVADDERSPKTILYPRDPSLDPQLVWKGKDEQDQQPLEVPALPIYIQEKISPQAIIETVRAQAAQAQPEEQLSLFSDFNNIEFGDLVDFYHHEQNWTNRMILGDSLLVMNSLAEKENLKGQVQMIYLDPPYGIKFGSNWQVSTRKRDVKDGKEEDITRQPEQIKAFRDTWELGIHSYLSYLRDRLTVARELLTESGSIFIQIGDENVHIVRSILDEVFGSDNFCGEIGYKKTGAFEALLLQRNFDYILWYAKNKSSVKFHRLFTVNAPTYDDFTFFDFIQNEEGVMRPIGEDEKKSSIDLKSKKLFSRNPLNSEGYVQSLHYPVYFNGETYLPPITRHWTTHQKGVERLGLANRLIKKGSTLRYVRYWDDYPASDLGIVWTDTGTGGFVGDDRIYVVQTTSRVIQRCLIMTTDPGDLVLDPTCGSGTTAYVAEQWGRRWITIDTSRVSIALARTRLMAGRYSYYLLSDSPEGVLKEVELSGQLPPSPLPQTDCDVRRGFVYKRVPHITLKSIANNEEIDVIYEKWQTELELLRANLNQALGQQWEEWQIPRELPKGASRQVAELHEKWWSIRRQRQQEIDASIARQADTEQLYDQPYEDNKKIRVSGPFTVESLSPHRVLSTDVDLPKSEQVTANGDAAGAGQFENMIIDNLRVAGVQNTKKGERLKLTYLETYSGTWIHAVGETKEKDGAVRRVAVCIGPEHGTVSPDLVKDAAKEAVQGVGFDLLVVLGYAFDPHVSEESRRYGKLTVLPARINPDLQMGTLALKKTSAANLFMVFGEPDIEVKSQADGKITVTVRGVDIYDPTTGEIRSSSTDDIACWFIDTDYNGESFFVRHAYFTGADEPYEKLKRALRAEIDEAAWSALYSTTSFPFEKPKSGKIAVKVINHYGDEALKVYGV